MAKNGVIYYAVGEKYIREAERSAESLAGHNDIDITVFTDKEIIKSSVFDTVNTINPSQYPFHDRISYFKGLDYSRTIHLDTDTIITGDIEPIFDLLDRFDIVAAHNVVRDTTAPHTKYETMNIDVPEAFPEYQCGVIGFNNSPNVMKFFSDWQERYDEHKHKNVIDQPFFRESLYNCNLKIGTLPPEYNILVNFCGFLQQSAKILHLAGNNSTPDQEMEEVINVINKDENRERVFYRDWLDQVRVKPEIKHPLYLRIIRSLSQDGFLPTSRKVLQKVQK
jgi:lipopolysaccharide biosynthesis glycosyltransferase